MSYAQYYNLINTTVAVFSRTDMLTRKIYVMTVSMVSIISCHPKLNPLVVKTVSVYLALQAQSAVKYHGDLSLGALAPSPAESSLTCSRL